MADELKTTRCMCRSCSTETIHKVLYTSSERGDDNYDYISEYSVVQCLGCETKGFLYRFVNVENAYPISDTDWDVPETVELYPRFSKDFRELSDLWVVPALVADIYKQSVSAAQEAALTLAGLGLRGTIEAICNERGISGRNLESRISKLATQGYISSRDSERLHGIRFLGNDAAHEIKKPTREQIGVALKIIDHLINSVYRLEEESAGKLDTLLRDFPELEKMLDLKLKEFAIGDEFPLAKFLGKDVRRLGSSASSLEARLVAEITGGNYSKLTVGKFAKFAGSPTDLQHFIVV